MVNTNKLIIGIILITTIMFAIIGLSGCYFMRASNNDNEIPDEIPDNPTSLLYKTVYKTNWLVTASIIGAAFAAAAFLNGSKMAAPIGIGCLVALALSLAVIRYATWLAGFTTVAAVLILIATILTKDKALKQIVTGVQWAKETIAGESNRGEKEAKEVINQVLAEHQDSTTQRLVAQVKDNLKLEGQI